MSTHCRECYRDKSNRHTLKVEVSGCESGGYASVGTLIAKHRMHDFVDKIPYKTLVRLAARLGGNGIGTWWSRGCREAGTDEARSGRVISTGRLSGMIREKEAGTPRQIQQLLGKLEMMAPPSPPAQLLLSGSFAFSAGFYVLLMLLQEYDTGGFLPAAMRSKAPCHNFTEDLPYTMPLAAPNCSSVVVWVS
ncbi:hypothetical protein Bbelb_060640 [Branchiostoma belcheri]|nr:hypothetical protein Bbelb_060640 [Branchiostoma belcheri]